MRAVEAEVQEEEDFSIYQKYSANVFTEIYEGDFFDRCLNPLASTEPPSSYQYVADFANIVYNENIIPLFECKLCNEVFMESGLCMIHFEHAHYLFPVSCPFCQRQFSGFYSLKVHCGKTHFEGQLTKADDASMKQNFEELTQLLYSGERSEGSATRKQLNPFFAIDTRSSLLKPQSVLDVDIIREFFQPIDSEKDAQKQHMNFVFAYGP